MHNCVNCKGENFEVLSQSSKSFRYKKCVGIETTEGFRNYTIIRDICLECGYVFEYMDSETLKKYIEDKPYFIQ